MSIYTKTGDGGETSLANGLRVSKTDCRIEAYGTIDELNSFVGLLRSEPLEEQEEQQLRCVQNILFNIGAALAEAPGSWITTEHVDMIESWIDQQQSQLPANHDFLLPYGSRRVALSHVCRTITRRAERLIIAKVKQNEVVEQQNVTILCFLNRLSDYFFVLSRTFCQKEGGKCEKWDKNAK